MTNSGSLAGREVVQIYIAAPVDGRITSPVKELKAFKKVTLAAGESTQVEAVLEKEAFSYFDERKDKWVAPAGTYRVLVGQDSAKALLEGEAVLEKTFSWLGL